MNLPGIVPGKAITCWITSATEFLFLSSVRLPYHFHGKHMNVRMGGYTSTTMSSGWWRWTTYSIRRFWKLSSNADSTVYVLWRRPKDWKIYPRTGRYGFLFQMVLTMLSYIRGGKVDAMCHSELAVTFQILLDKISTYPLQCPGYEPHKSPAFSWFYVALFSMHHENLPPYAETNYIRRLLSSYSNGTF